MTSMIYKICDEQLWRDAESAGVFRGAEIDLQDGYIHFSSASQVKATAAKHFGGRSNLLIIAVDEESLGEYLKWEVSRDGQKFPHLYANLPTSGIAWCKPLPLLKDGTHQFPEPLT